MTFNSPGNVQPASQQQRGIIVTYLSPVEESPMNLVFNNQAVGTASPAQTITITNTGTGNLNFRSNGSLFGTNAPEFAVSAGSTCFNWRQRGGRSKLQHRSDVHSVRCRHTYRVGYYLAASR
jgi:hypothetical protein